jgi:glucosamine--fructose-6-phosphate aminotransferase (isomerizing)
MGLLNYNLSMLQETLLYKEIHEQPQVLARLVERELHNVQALTAAMRQHDVQYVVIAARGTSDNAGRYANYLLGAMNGLVVGLATPSLYTIYKRPPRFRHALVLGISQSGKSPDIVAVLAEARRQGALTAAITNELESDLAQEADHIIELGVGKERSVAASKTYTSALATIALLSACLADDPDMLSALHRVPEIAAQTLGVEGRVEEIVQRYRYMRECVVIGRGYNYATAFELALKLKELTYTMVEPYSSADFLHGPLAMIEHGFPAIVITPSGAMLPEMREFMGTLRERQAEILAISDDAETLALAHIPLQLPAPVPEWLSPIVAILPGQLLAMHLAYIRNYDPDRPRGLSKVTETV